ncbi:HAD family hydrolase [Anaeromicropila populeti]|uniref:Cof subfamily of IIB subfamily of haloacid dehalogenase superfamily/HAD-superfamily hydrolase, subfamily IIB n=1 Tax=Anaeromicropila populeti TaxID=37658 RepID=A0A1I6JBC9_9FIRM|nr:HAD family hydrolase [Anaeromicropila populeti]SFR76258.1 Cof subfamily of IIB subfamily of haloacid dehalogenase superfamily/HAD-superfamily hydrolase, subfamily IIB [Anaeromicropila populeti]
MKLEVKQDSQEKKLVFLDIDGTLIDMETGILPDSTKTAIKKARENGHKVFICSGRCKAIVPSYILETGFDGMVCSAGAYVEAEGKVIFHQPLLAEDLKEIVDFLNDKKIGFFLEANERLYTLPEYKRMFWEREELANRSEREDFKQFFQNIQEIRIEDAIGRNDINKLTFFSMKNCVDDIKNQLADKFMVITSSMEKAAVTGGEISAKTITKAEGIRMVLDHYNMGKEATLAIGDSMNDKEMIQFAQVGIAMGNAIDAIKEVADDITAEVMGDGIYKSFLKYGLLD